MWQKHTLVIDKMLFKVHIKWERDCIADENVNNIDDLTWKLAVVLIRKNNVQVKSKTHCHESLLMSEV